MGGTGHIRDKEDAGEVEVTGIAEFGDAAHGGHGHHCTAIDGGTDVIAMALDCPGALEQVVIRQAQVEQKWAAAQADFAEFER